MLIVIINQELYWEEDSGHFDNGSDVPRNLVTNGPTDFRAENFEKMCTYTHGHDWMT